jgi:hypothetical protein
MCYGFIHSVMNISAFCDLFFVILTLKSIIQGVLSLSECFDILST